MLTVEAMLKRKPLLIVGSQVVVFLLNACGSSTPLSVQDPVVANISALPGGYNPLSCAVTADVGNAVTVRVAYSAESGPDVTTPDFAVSSSSVTIPVLGLMPETNYTLVLQAIGADGTTVESDSASCLTGALPSTLPAFAVSEQAGTELGYTMIGLIQGLFSGSSSSGGESSTPIAGPLIVDHTGRIVWYREGFEGAVTDWQKQPDGTYTAAINQIYIPELGYNDNRYFQLDSLGNVIRTYSALGWPTDNHELRLLSNGDALLMANNSQSMDLTPWGGRPSVVVFGDVLQRISPTGGQLFAWDALNGLDIGSTDPLILQDLADADSLDFTHANAIDVSADGSYLISLRNLSQVIKVNQSGSIVWRLGGVNSDFQFVNDPLGRFSLQHGMRELPNGNILLFDNGVGHQPPQSRAVEYQLDLNAMTATLVWQYDADPHLFGPFLGFTQRLANGNTLITYGAHPVIREVNPAGEVVWELQGAATDGFYRAIRIPSLY